jgi:hypothetical protein
MSPFLIRIVANIAVAVGLGLLTRVIYRTAVGSVSAQLFPQLQGSWTLTMLALGLSLPVPFHVISVGFFLQKRWLSPFWAKTTRVAVVASGCWLGAALGIKLLLLGH